MTFRFFKRSGNKVYSKEEKMMLGIAIGDAFGAGYEMVPRYKVKSYLNLTKYSRRKKWKEGMYTDDTQMSLAVVELLISKEDFTKENLADYFIKVYKRDTRGGYSGAMGRLLKRCQTGKDLIKIREIGSKKIKETNFKGGKCGNGAAMRAVPIGILPNIKDVIKYAKLNAEITHNMPAGIASSVGVACASHYFYYNLGEPKKVIDFCIKNIKGIDNETIDYLQRIKEMDELIPEILFGESAVNFGVLCDGMKTLGAILYILARYSDSPFNSLIEAVKLGGDADSTACIALGIASMNNNFDDLPKFLLNKLENGKFGKDYLIKLGKSLHECIVDKKV